MQQIEFEDEEFNIKTDRSKCVTTENVEQQCDDVNDK